MSDEPEKKRWEILEAWLFDNEVEKFTSRELAGSLEILPEEASHLIAAYLSAQRGAESSTLYVLKREGRTSAAVWSIGQRTADAKMIGGTLFEDVSIKAKRAFEPDLNRLKERNPRAARYCEAKIEAVMGGVLAILAAAVDQHLEED